MGSLSMSWQCICDVPAWNTTPCPQCSPQPEPDDPTCATTGQLDELARQISELERKLTSYFPDPMAPERVDLPWTVPYVTWTSLGIHEARLNDVEESALETKNLSEAHQTAFESYQEEISEQLDRRFIGLRDAQNTRFRSVEERVGRLEQRMMKGEIQEMYLSERVTVMQSRMEKLAGNCVKEFTECRERRCRDIKAGMLGLEGKIAILSEIMGIPTFLTSPDIPRALETGSTRDPRWRPGMSKEEKEEGELSSTDSEDKSSSSSAP